MSVLVDAVDVRPLYSQVSVRRAFVASDAATQRYLKPVCGDSQRVHYEELVAEGAKSQTLDLVFLLPCTALPPPCPPRPRPPSPRASWYHRRCHDVSGLPRQLARRSTPCGTTYCKSRFAAQTIPFPAEPAHSYVKIRKPFSPTRVAEWHHRRREKASVKHKCFAFPG